MPLFFCRSSVLALLLAGLTVPPRPGGTQEPRVRSTPRDTLRAFTSDAELVSYVRDLREEHQRRLRQEQQEARRRREAAARCTAPAPTARTTSLPAPAPGSAIIRGRVTEPAGSPLAHAHVGIEELKIARASDTSGAYRLVIPAESLSVGGRRVTVRVRRIGSDPAQHTVIVRMRDTVHLDFALCPAAGPLSEVRLRGAVANFQAQAEDQITNTQHEGVDEGGIVKLNGDYLVILRRGRLFTVAVGGRAGDRDLLPISAVDAFGPGIDPRHAWYDELLIAGDKVVVIGYSYQRGGTEIGVFRMDRRGGLRYLATYQLRSNDYYSSRNYAARLIGTKLAFYAPLYLWYQDDLFAAFPAIRRWSPRAGDTAFKRIVPAERVYRTPRPITGFDVALHAVTTCDLVAEEMACQATAVLGPASRVFYVSPHAVYVWVSSWGSRGRSESAAMLYRMPLDGAAPSALGVSGSPVDQFSFLESDDGQLNVLVRSGALGDAMWRPERSAGDAALLRIPVASFGDGTDVIPWWRYRPLPAPAEYEFHNRFVGDHLLYGVGSGWGRPRAAGATLYVVRWRDASVTPLDLPHGVDRIEVLGRDAVVVGADTQSLYFTAIRLRGTPEAAQRFTMAGASQGELRRHGFFYRADFPDSGVLGLPVREAARPGWRHLIEGSAGVLFLRSGGRRFDRLGLLRASDEKPVNDRCRAWCVDSYGNARPLFFRGRIVALLGYELVEGEIVAGEIRELARVSFAPGVGTAVRR